jgi:NhaA family Na+:H+ antiporter
MNWCRLPAGVKRLHLLAAGMLAGIGFTMSIFISNLAFAGNHSLVDQSKMAVLIASLLSSLFGGMALLIFTRSIGETGNSATSEDTVA